MTRAKKIYLYLSLVGVHLLVAMVAFLKFRLNPMHILFDNEGDGLKNAFTLETYVREPIGHDGIFKYNSMNYPFGDYVYYTDNTPLFAIPFRWFCQHVWNLSAYTLPLFSLFVILTIVLSGVIVLHLFRRLRVPDGLAWVMAVILPWTNMQVWRIWHGNYNLSFSWLSLLAIALLIRWHDKRDKPRAQAWVAVWMVLLVYVGFLAHGYYMAIIPLFLASMLFFYGILKRKQPAGRRALYTAIAVPAVALVVVMGTLFVTDGYLSMRPAAAHGYDGAGSKTQVSGLVSHYFFQEHFFFLHYQHDNGNIEAATYLGNVGLYALFALCIAAVASVSWRRRLWEAQRNFFKDPVRAGIFLGSLVLLSVSLGEHYYTQDDPGDHGFMFINLTNPFFYLHQVTRRVEQFRYISRFIWPFYFGFYVWIVCTLSALREYVSRRTAITVIVGVALAGGLEVKDYVNALQAYAARENLLDAEHAAAAKPQHIDVRQYQALLALPYYHVGSEDYPVTIDDANAWSAHTYAIQLATGLPLMNCKMSRVPQLYNHLLIDWVAYDSTDARLTGKLNDKPILVAYNSRLAQAEPPSFIEKGSGHDMMYRAALNLPERHHLQAVDSVGDVLFYSYYPKR